MNKKKTIYRACTMHASGNKDVQNYENYTLFTRERKL